MVRLNSTYSPMDWPDSTIAQSFADVMHDKLQHLVNAGNECVREGVPQTPEIQELIKHARGIQDEYATRIVKRESWTRLGDSDTPMEWDESEANMVAYLGTQYYIDLRNPRTDNELRNLAYQLEALSRHFNELTRPLRLLRPKTVIPSSTTTIGGIQIENGDLRKKVWTRNQEMIFEELKDTLFDIVRGQHTWTRQAKVRAYHPHITTPPSHTDTNGIVI